MRYDVYYSIKGREQVPDTSPVSIELDELVFDVFPNLECDGDFVGLIDAEGRALQAAYDQASDCFWLEIPDPSRQGSHGCWLAYETLLDVMRSLPPLFEASAIPQLTFHPWAAMPPAPARVRG